MPSSADISAAVLYRHCALSQRSSGSPRRRPAVLEAVFGAVLEAVVEAVFGAVLEAAVSAEVGTDVEAEVEAEVGAVPVAVDEVRLCTASGGSCGGSELTAAAAAAGAEVTAEDGMCLGTAAAAEGGWPSGAVSAVC